MFDTNLKLISSASRGDVNACLQALERGANVKASDIEGQSALHMAAENGHPKTCQLLLECGADPNVVNILGRTPLHAAAAYRQLDACLVLLEQGVDVNAKDGGGMTPLHLAAMCGQFKSLMLVRDIDCHFSDGQTEFHKVVKRKYADVCDALIARGAFVNAKDKFGRTPLLISAQWASLCDKHEYPDNLSEIDAKSSRYGCTKKLVFSRYAEVVLVLLEKGADIGIKDKNGLGTTEIFKEFGAVKHKDVFEILARWPDI